MSESSTSPVCCAGKLTSTLTGAICMKAAICVQPVLMLERADVAADINRLHGLKQQGVDMDGLLLDLGRVMELKQAIAAAKSGTSVPVRSYSATDIADMAELARRQLRLAIDAVGLPSSRTAAVAHACAHVASKCLGAISVPYLCCCSSGYAEAHWCHGLGSRICRQCCSLQTASTSAPSIRCGCCIAGMRVAGHLCAACGSG